jgi:hypothetical protein
MKNSFIFLTSFLFCFIFSCAEHKEKVNVDEKTTKNYDTQELDPNLQIVSDSLSQKDITTFTANEKIIPKYKYDEIEWKLNGKVKSVTSRFYTEYKIENGFIGIDAEYEGIHYKYYICFKQNGEQDWNNLHPEPFNIGTKTITTDSIGRPLVEIRHTLQYGQFSDILIWEYDDHKNMSIEKSYDTVNQLNSFTKYYYDANKNLTSYKECKPNGETILKRHWLYDSNSNATAHYSYNYRDGVLTSEEYEYYFYIFDDFQNWIMKYTYDANNTLGSITTREIEYYQ